MSSGGRIITPSILIVMGMFGETTALAASNCYVTGTSVPANTYFLDVPFTGGFFSAHSNGGTHIHFVTETPGYAKYIDLSPGIKFTPDRSLVYKNAYIRLEYMVSPYWDGPFFFIERDDRSKVKSLREIVPKTDPSKSVINVVYTRLQWGGVETFETLTSRNAWLERICWADKKSEFPAVLNVVKSPANIQGYKEAASAKEINRDQK